MAATMKRPSFSKTWTWFEDRWHEGNVPIMGPRTHGAWLGSTVFDGARRFEEASPDLDRHMMRINDSARKFGLKPIVSDSEWLALAQDGIARFDPAAALYIRPMYWAESGAAGGGVKFDPESTNWCLCIYEAPMPSPGNLAITHSPFRKPSRDCAPVDAKAGCLYPNNGRALSEADSRGFGNCLMTDLLGNVAELANANVFMARGGDVYTPAPNGTFLNGITRRRVADLLRGSGVSVHETALRYEDFLTADEIFSTGNFSKVMPVTRIDERNLQPGPIYTRARELYWEFAHGTK
ncbi:branched-chain amino acid aminotransferase [soil metagenome]